jgi:hypothetical protein
LGLYLQGSIRQIPEEDFRLIESEMKKVVAERVKREEAQPRSLKGAEDSEADVEAGIMALPLEAKTLHDRLGEIPDHAYELDVTWLSGKNPEVAIEIQISGNLTEAKDRLAHARKFNYRKVILVCRKADLLRVNVLLKHDPELRNWMEAWSIGAIYKMYVAGKSFFKYYRQLIESVYKEKSDIDLVI